MLAPRHALQVLKLVCRLVRVAIPFLYRLSRLLEEVVRGALRGKNMSEKKEIKSEKPAMLFPKPNLAHRITKVQPPQRSQPAPRKLVNVSFAHTSLLDEATAAIAADSQETFFQQVFAKKKRMQYENQQFTT